MWGSGPHEFSPPLPKDQLPRKRSGSWVSLQAGLAAVSPSRCWEGRRGEVGRLQKTVGASHTALLGDSPGEAVSKILAVSFPSLPGVLKDGWPFKIQGAGKRNSRQGLTRRLSQSGNAWGTRCFLCLLLGLKGQPTRGGAEGEWHCCPLHSLIAPYEEKSCIQDCIKMKQTLSIVAHLQIQSYGLVTKQGKVPHQCSI